MQRHSPATLNPTIQGFFSLRSLGLQVQLAMYDDDLLTNFAQPAGLLYGKQVWKTCEKSGGSKHRIWEVEKPVLVFYNHYRYKTEPGMPRIEVW